ncbi:hypothetical protein I7I50_04223 [Histoplasma capsulatum G186AR]|uniref:Uncharacterized protein n=1 Tax=Ajellomyces capsulatus TaxID=5037 RepID=A0A8H7YP93_AJECA|nr:hypothetical protein I7I52_05131 [Histoplasma capsulatum]QSS75175.1 hypothetical protein I7I50_04223 [Histoplasma capsulatum G186AR]
MCREPCSHDSGIWHSKICTIPPRHSSLRSIPILESKGSKATKSTLASHFRRKAKATYES